MEFLVILGIIVVIFVIWGALSGENKTYPETFIDDIKKSIEREIKKELNQPESPFFPRTTEEKKLDIFNKIEMCKISIAINSASFCKKYHLNHDMFVSRLDSAIDDLHRKYRTF